MSERLAPRWARIDACAATANCSTAPTARPARPGASTAPTTSWARSGGSRPTGPWPGPRACAPARCSTWTCRWTRMDPPLAAARRTARHTIFGRNAFHRDEHLDDVFPQVSSQIDGLRHFGNPDHGFYNGASGERLVPGDPLLGVQHWAEHGIVGRGVLVDVARHRDAAAAADRPPGGRADPDRRRRRRGRTPGQPVRARRHPAPALRVAAPLPHGDDRGRAQRAARRAPPSRARPVPRHVGVVVGQRVRARRGGQLRAGVLAAGGVEPVPHRGRAGGRAGRRRTPASCTA